MQRQVALLPASLGRQSTGPSGSNREYLIELAKALESNGVEDHHIQSLVSVLNRDL